MTDKKRIGIFGGSFDPFTLSHREIVKQAIKQNLVDRVVIVPTIVDYYRQNKRPWLGSSEKIRVIKALVDDLNSVIIDETEMNRRDLLNLSPELEKHAIKDWRFIDTLLRLKLERVHTYGGEKSFDFYPIIGGDSLDNFKTWFAWKDILKQSAGLIVAERDCKTIDVEDFVSKNPEFDGKLKVMKIDADVAYTSASEMRAKWEYQLPSKYINWALAMVAIKNRAQKEKKNLLLHTPIFDVVRGKKTETGLEPILVKAPDWVSIVAKKNGKVLVEKQLRYGSNLEIEEFPCGMVENFETPHKAVSRELEEETGIKVDTKWLTYLGSTNPNPAFMTNRMHYFFVDLDTAEYEQVEQKLDEHERITFHWENLDDFAERIMDLARKSSQKVPAILLSAFALLEDAVKNNIIEL